MAGSLDFSFLRGEAVDSVSVNDNLLFDDDDMCDGVLRDVNGIAVPQVSLFLKLVESAMSCSLSDDSG